MPRTSAKPSQCFSKTTCDRLLQLIIDPTVAPSQLHDQLETLVSSDGEFEQWLATKSPGILDAAGEFHLPWLASHLSSDPDWTAGESHEATTLRKAATLVDRVHQLEKRFDATLQAQKNQAVYNLAYGLSHELNNPLANIATRASVLSKGETNANRCQMLQSIMENAMRGCEMLGDLMLVARPPHVQVEPTDVAALVRDIVTQVMPWAEPRDITVESALPDEALLAIDPVAIREAIWALVRNGMEAMPDGGKVSIKAIYRDIVGASGTQQHFVIEIADTGAGLSDEALANCFDPYYCGREAGRGLGLGLTKAQRFVELHGGQVTLANGKAQGCVATILLPA
ncbi:MAG: HAMP domain-containing sensor histidine kinase [Pirellulaceae bacterium]